jgi:hypothetical protein
LQRRVA